MRLHSPLDDLIRGRGTLRVLRRLCLQPRERFTATELARLEDLALSHVQSALAILEGNGIVGRVVSGRAHLWSLVQRNALVGPLTAVFRAERDLPIGLEGELRKALAPLPVRRAILFGSVLGGTESGWSDVDLYLEIRHDSDRDQVFDGLVKLSNRVKERFGLNLAPIVVPEGGRGEGVSVGFVARLEQDGRLIVGHK